MPAPYDLDLYHGDTARWQFNVWQDPINSIPANLGGCTAAAQIRDRPGGSDLAEMTCVVSGSSILMTLPAAESAKLPVSARGWTGAWDLQLTYPSGDVLTLLYGQAYVTADVTVVP